jgi:hypothetical protein
LNKANFSEIRIPEPIRVIDCDAFTFEADDDYDPDRGEQERVHLNPSKYIVSIQFPTSLEFIRRDCFQFCDNLSILRFAEPSRLREINGFVSCPALRKLTLPDSVEVIGSRAFTWCAELCEIEIGPDSHLREIYGFASCGSLVEVEIPASVVVIGENGFWGCIHLAKVVFRDGSKLRKMHGCSFSLGLREIDLKSPLLETVGQPGLKSGRTFINFDDDNNYLKRSRRSVHLAQQPRWWRRPRFN